MPALFNNQGNLTESISNNVTNRDKVVDTKIISRDSPQTILIDEYAQHPTQEFESLGYTIANLIKRSHPRFTIGIYGEWGTGKTTLMRSIEASLKENNGKSEQKVLPVWFNAWKFEREEHLASIALMKTIAFTMQGHVKFDAISHSIFKGLSIPGRDVKQKYILDSLTNNSVIPYEFDVKLKHLNDLEKHSIYFDGLKVIKNEIEKIRNIEGGKEYRVVVFIDDLDRCSSKKALEVLESIKVFLDIEGFVYVIGLSHKTVTKLITRAYKETGVQGEDYIQKIIQIPIRIPEWSHENLINLIDTKILPQLNGDYARFLRQNAQIISKVVSANPRQLKRFINNVIIAFETFSSQRRPEDWIVEEIFLVQILRTEWGDFYNEFSREKNFREFVQMIITARDSELKKYFRHLQNSNEADPSIEKIKRQKFLYKFMERTSSVVTLKQLETLSEFDFDIWGFFIEFQDILFNIHRWQEISHITEVVEEIPYNLNLSTSEQNKEDSG